MSEQNYDPVYFSFSYPLPVIYTFTPQPDITVYELALCMTVTTNGVAREEHVLELPESARRHFVKEG